MIIKNLSNFIRYILSKLEKNIKAILILIVRKVLIIDKAYSLFNRGIPNRTSVGSNKYRTTIIDIIIAKI